eukprot:gnl/MRDRNA2_/MRDRNA2_147697_c0_seq1.p1 gnl/MRDRNA2_/MRDRNA2_147697_c0~~gnl/MRDRNA2_/MRDRNA2_147697_c0_seq1.p1  ORF type:complete len:244 (+),score=38.69 gnl/MRDRNA2_/MRDRNA2_147697_c0_seq1:82-813(+)
MVKLDSRGIALSALGFLLTSIIWWRNRKRTCRQSMAVLPCIRKRRSMFPRDYIDEKIDASIVKCLLEAAMWAPFHGPRAPWRFVVLGRNAMIEMQRMTLDFYDKNWQQTGWASGTHGSESQYQEWRAMTEEEITGRWGPVSYMIGIVMQRQAHPEKRMPEWEEAAATACAVQNMHIQASEFPGLACYWSSWHDAARDSSEMKAFLGMRNEDKCLGFFIVAACRDDLKDRRKRYLKDCSIEWRA